MQSKIEDKFDAQNFVFLVDVGNERSTYAKWMFCDDMIFTLQLPHRKLWYVNLRAGPLFIKR